MSQKKDGDEVKLEFLRVLADPAAPIKAAQNFGFSSVGSDYQLDIGFFDMVNLKETVDKAKMGEESELYFVVTDRFFLSAKGFEVLKAKINDLEEKLKKKAAEGSNASE